MCRTILKYYAVLRSLRNDDDGVKEDVANVAYLMPKILGKYIVNYL